MKEEKEFDSYFYIAGWILLFLLIFCIRSPFHIPCIFHTFTGYYCPGCGGTRAVYAFLHFDLLASFYYHPFVPYLFILGGYFMITQTLERIVHRQFPFTLHFRSIYLWIGVAIILFHFFISNILLLWEFAG